MKNKKFIIFLIIIVFIILTFLGIYFFKKISRDYDIEIINKKNYYTIYENGKVGVINIEGKTIINPQYNAIQIPNPEKDVFICFNGNNGFALNASGIQIFTEFDSVLAINVSGIIGDIPFEKSVLKYKQNGKWGLMDLNGKIITEALYDEIESVPYKEGEILVSLNGKKGVINSKGVMLLNIEFDEIVGDGYFNNVNYKEAGYIVSKYNNTKKEYGYINKDGMQVLKCEFDEIVKIRTDNENVYLICSKDGKKSLFNNGKKISLNDYDQIEFNEELDLLKVKQNEFYGVINLTGNILIPIEYSQIEFAGIYIVATKANMILEFDTQGNELKNVIYKKVIKTSNNNFYITVAQNNLYGIINEKNVEVTVNKYAYIEYLFGDYFLAYNTNNQIGVIDYYGREIVPIKFSLIQQIKGTNAIQVIDNASNTLYLYNENMKLVYSSIDCKVYVDTH